MSTLPPEWHHLVDDSAVLHAADSLPDALARRAAPYGALLGALLVADRDLGRVSTGLIAPEPVPVALVVTGGAGGIVPALGLARARGVLLARLETTLRDPDDLAGNARRVVAAVDAARMEGVLDEEPVHVELPAAPPGAAWLRAADELAAAGLGLAFRLDDPDQRPPEPREVVAWVDAALDRDLRFTCAGPNLRLRSRVGGVGVQPGLVGLLMATAAAFDGTSAADCTALLTQPGSSLPDPPVVASARRWLASVATDAADDLAADLWAQLQSG